MKRYARLLAGSLAFACALPSGAVRADEGDVFLSLTRTAEPADRMPTHVSVVTAREIENAGAQTLNEALELLPSVDIQKAPSLGQKGSLRLRGVPSSNQVQVVVDDQPLGGVFLQDLDTGQIGVQDVERIEVVRGGGSVLYGANAVGGVVHVITKKGASGPAVSSVGYESRSFRTQIQQADLRRKDGRADMAISASSRHTDGFQKNSDGTGLSASASGGWSFANGARLSLEASRTDNESGVPGGTTAPFEQWNGAREKEPVNALARARSADTRVRLRGAFPAGPATVQTVFFGSNGDYVYKDPVFFADTDQDKNILGNDTRVLLPGRLTLGASYERDEFREKGSPKRHGEDWGLYVQKAFTLGDLDLIPAFRSDQHSAFGNVHNPRLTAVWRAGEKLKFSADAGRSFRSPTFVDLNQSYPAFLPFAGPFLANPQLRPETAWTYDLGVQAGRPDGTVFSLTGYHTRLTDRIAATNNPAPAANSLVNAPRAEMTGVELEVKGRWGFLTHHGSYTYQRAVGSSIASTRHVPLRFTPRHLAELQVTAEARRRWRLTNVVQYSHKQYESDGEQGKKLASYALWNARLEKDVLGARFFAAADNVLNRRYADSTNFGLLVPQPGRGFQAGVTVRFTD